MKNRKSWFDPRALKRTFSLAVVLRSLLVAIVVGTVLNLINQGSEIASGKPIDIAKLLLTYAVPYFVASFGAYSAYRQVDLLDETRQ